MHKKRILAALCLLVSALGLLTWGRARQAARPAQEPTNQEASPEVPDQIAYLHLFRQIAAFKKRAKELEREGKNSSALKTYFKRNVGLAEADAQVLDEIADQCAVELQHLDAKAKAAIDAFRAQSPGGRVPTGETPKPPPAELRAMTEERDAIVLRYRDLLRASFGDETFARIHDLAKKRRAPDIAPPPASKPAAQ